MGKQWFYKEVFTMSGRDGRLFDLSKDDSLYYHFP